MLKESQIQEAKLRVSLEKVSLEKVSSEKELVLATRAGDKKAFDELTKRYWTRCRHVAWIYTRNREDAEDRAQESFLRAWIHIRDCEPSKFRSWLDMIVQNQSKMFRRDNRRRINPIAYHIKLIPSTELGPERLLEQIYLARLVRFEVSQLPRPWREVIQLYRLEERAIEEVASMLNIGVHAAKSRLVWATKALRKRLRRRLVVKI